MKVFFGVNESGVAYWRGKLPAWKIRKLGLCEVSMFSVYDTDMTKGDELVGDSDVVYVPSAVGVDSVAEFLNYHKTGKSIVTDYDDNLFDCHPFNPGYQTLGLKEIKLRIPNKPETWMWRHGQMGFDLKDNHMRAQSQTDILQISNIVTTTTTHLRDKLHEQASNRDIEDFEVLPNAIDFDLYKPFDKQVRSHKKLRIGWTASDSHILEGQLMFKIMTELYKRRQDFTFVILGNIEKFRAAIPKMEVEWHPFCDISIYPMKVASLELDIGVCPLDDYSFNHTKSALKWSEYSAFGIPSVCSDLTPYKVITSGRDGILADTPEQFVDGIELLMDSADQRKKIREAAYEHNYEHYNLDKIAHKWVEVFERAMLSDRTLTYKGQVIERVNGRAEDQEVSV